MVLDRIKIYLFGLSYAILLGSFVYVFPNYKDLWFFLEIMSLPAIYMIGYELLMRGIEKDTEELNIYVSELERKAIMLGKEKEKLIKQTHQIKKEKYK